jgi:RNA polymerase-binding transcription factor DksA
MSKAKKAEKKTAKKAAPLSAKRPTSPKAKATPKPGVAAAKKGGNRPAMKKSATVQPPRKPAKKTPAAAVRSSKRPAAVLSRSARSAPSIKTKVPAMKKPLDSRSSSAGKKASAKLKSKAPAPKPAAAAKKTKTPASVSKGKKAAQAPAARATMLRKLLDLRSGFQKSHQATKKKAAPAPKATKRPVPRLLQPDAEKKTKPVAPKPLPKKAPIKKADLEKLHMALEEEHARLLHDLEILDELNPAQSENGGNENSAFSSHIAEHATDNSMLETTLMQRRLVEDRLSQVVEALQRLDQGTYGICETCSEFIGVERLVAKPHARLCIQCRRDAERRRSLGL